MSFTPAEIVIRKSSPFIYREAGEFPEFGFNLDLWQHYSTNFKSDFSPGTPYSSSTKMILSKVSETPFSCRNVAVFVPILKPKIKEIGMPEIGRRFYFASRSETNSLIELKFRLEVPNTSIKRKQKSYSRLNNKLAHNNRSFHRERCVPNPGRFHTC